MSSGDKNAGFGSAGDRSAGLLWLRTESKAFEQRTLLTPAVALQLIQSGFDVVVERSEQRAFADDEYEAIGCTLSEPWSWCTAPQHAIIMGLKELAVSDGPFSRRHVHFAHVYKQQRGWQDMLSQFKAGGGALYDLEYLTHEDGRRVAAFGYWAGFVGAAVSLLAFCAKQQGSVLGALSSWPDKQSLVSDVQMRLARLPASTEPKALVIGALGRCGTGATELFESCNIPYSAWDQKETAPGGPFVEILEHDILVNCVFVNSLLPKFTTLAHVSQPGRKLQVISDVSCDPFGEYNPLPVTTRCTTMSDPVDVVLSDDGSSPALHLISIDHLPSLLPRESSEDFATQLLPALKSIDNLDQGAWARAHKVFIENLPA